MPFITSNGLTEAGTSKTIAAGGMNVHYHDLGEGEPVLFLHSYGPGTTAWITFHKTVGELSQHFRCILMDMPNFSKTGPIVYREAGPRAILPRAVQYKRIPVHQLIAARGFSHGFSNPEDAPGFPAGRGLRAACDRGERPAAPRRPPGGGDRLVTPSRPAFRGQGPAHHPHLPRRRPEPGPFRGSNRGSAARGICQAGRRRRGGRFHRDLLRPVPHPG